MPDPAGRYIDLAFLQKFWGAGQIDLWCDTDGDGVRGTADDLVIQEAIDDAEDDVDNHLSSAYAAPFTGTIPRMVKKLARLRTGVYLYARRGLREGADLAGQMRGWWDLTDKLLADLRNGKLNLPGVARKRTIGVVAPERLFTRETLGF